MVNKVNTSDIMIDDFSPVAAQRSIQVGDFPPQEDGRDQCDHYPTPAWVAEALLERERFGRAVWEPACGTGELAEVLKRRGYQVRSSDLVDRGYGQVEDFLKSTYVSESIVTNPPFKLGAEFVERALKRAAFKIALFLPLTFLESVRRHGLLVNSPLQMVYIFSRRVSLYQAGVENRGGGRMPLAWFVWRQGYEGFPMIDWITP